jgi:hypothetical protein
MTNPIPPNASPVLPNSNMSHVERMKRDSLRSMQMLDTGCLPYCTAEVRTEISYRKCMEVCEVVHDLVRASKFV